MEELPLTLASLKEYAFRHDAIMGDVMFRNIYKIYYFQEKIKILNITMLLWCGVDDDL